ncbi:S-layer family protein [Leptolyngbya sp. FACHB-261]|uniref:beta strand repeat-containing protein n=1 Tax=Leptolyngbya sp. FACHB-261 TaxID=2692806 RepID=UPI001685016B|nr:S-layer family protein [Leptolyngbya sp. FACHB-261]MBD2102812.1 S-layer family protein [Leptolyngbya sp. FACHB-261]
MKEDSPFWIVGRVSLVILVVSNPAQAQVVPDTAPETNLGTQVRVNGSTFEIRGGTRAGNASTANLFHSFSSFSIPSGKIASFLDTQKINNILVRVTSGSPSNIQGIIRANQGTPNLFLINPSGIIFGPRARLDVAGSFVATTASGIQFPGGSEFSLTSGIEPQNPLLTVNPSAFLFNQIATAPNLIDPKITVENGAALSVRTGRSLLLIGGDVALDRGTLRAPAGRVELAGVSAGGTVGLAVEGNDLSLRVPSIKGRADVSLTNDARIDTSSTIGGRVAIYANNLLATDSTIVSTSLGTQAGVNAPLNTRALSPDNPGSIILDANSLSFNNASVSTTTLSSGQGGDIALKARSVALDQSTLVSSTSSSGNAGRISIQAQGSVSLNRSSLSSAAESAVGPVGDSGDIQIEARTLSLVDRAEILALTAGRTIKDGRGGNVTIKVQDNVSLAANSRISTETFGEGQGGNIEINANSLFLTDSALRTASSGTGNAGNLLINVDNIVSVNRVKPSNTFPFPIGFSTSTNGSMIDAGDAGQLTIETEHLTIRGGARAAASTAKQGQGGRLTVHAATVELIGTSDSSSPKGQEPSGLFTETLGAGDAGQLTIDAQRLDIRDGARASASTSGVGQGGTLKVNANSIRLNGTSADGRLASSLLTESLGRGAAGGVEITADRLDIRNGARASASTAGQGQGGTLNAAAAAINLEGTANGRPSGLFAETRGARAGGDIEVKTDHLNVQDGAQVSVSGSGSGRAGDIRIEANSLELDRQAALSAKTRSSDGGNIAVNLEGILTLRHNSQITTTAGTAQAGGNGGNIDLNAQFVLAVPTENSDITANAFLGNGGNVRIRAQDILGVQFRRTTTEASDITASSDFGTEGVVAVDRLAADPSRGLTDLPETLVDVTALIAQRCPVGNAQTASQFVVTGRGGLPPNPQEAIRSPALLADLGRPHPAVANPPDTAQPAQAKAIPVEPTRIIEAQGWIVAANGDVLLTAQVPTAPQSGGQRVMSCSGA